MLQHQWQGSRRVVLLRFVAMVATVAGQVVSRIGNRGIDDAGQKCTFRKVKVIDIFAEIIKCRILNAARTAVASKPDHIQIVDQDISLTDALLCQQTEINFLDLQLDIV